MRNLVIGAALLASAGAAHAQRVVTPGPSGGFRAAPPAPAMQAPPPPMTMQPRPMRPGPGAAPAQHVGQHWGGRMNGHWVGGMRAPGGWAAYRRPYRGFALSGYWNSPGFYVSDWSAYGLAQPPYGYIWARYYDDAVLLDQGGRVSDSVSGIDWDRYDMDQSREWDAYQANRSAYDDRGGHADRRGDEGYGPPPGYDGERHRRHGRNDGPPPPPPGFAGAGYPPPPPGYLPPPPPGGFGRQTVVQGGGGTIVTTTAAASPPNVVYVGGGSSVTTVTIATAPVVTTTTEIFEDNVTYTRTARRVIHRRVHRRPACACRS